MELPIEKQFRITDALFRDELSIRDTSELFDIAKSTAQDYKKRGPPILRKYLKNHGNEPYPASVKEENELLRQAIQDVLRQAAQAVDQRDTANKKVADLTVIKSLNESEIEKQKQEKEKLQKTVNEQKDEKVKMKLDYQQELEKEKTKAEEEKKSEIFRIKTEFLGILQDRNDKLTKAEDENNLPKKNNKIISDERDILNDKVWNLEKKQKNAPIITTTVGVTCLGVGGAVGWWLRGRKKNPTLPRNIEYGKNTSTPVIPILQKWISQPDIHYTHSGVTPEINTSGTLSSGAFYSTNGEKYDNRYDAIPNKPDDVIHLTIYHINSGINLVTNSSGTQCSGAYKNNYGGTKGI